MYRLLMRFFRRPRYAATIMQSSRGKWRIIVRDPDGEAVLMSCGRGWDTRADAEDMVDRIVNDGIGK